MLGLLKKLGTLFGFGKDSKYVRNFMYDQNVRSGIFMGAIIFAMEVWLIIRQTMQYFDRYGANPTFEGLLNYDSVFILFLLTGAALCVYGISRISEKMSKNAKLISNLVASGITFLFSFYLFYPKNFQPWDNSLQNNVLNSFIIIIYVAAMILSLLIIAHTLLTTFRGLKLEFLSNVTILLFAVLCLAFGIRVSFSDHARLLAKNIVSNEIICFLMMSIYVACLLIWKPWISILVNFVTFALFYILIYNWDIATQAVQYSVERNGTTYYAETFSEGDLINYITFFISLTTVCVMIYHQRRRNAIKDEELSYLAQYDDLTGLNNYSYFIKTVDEYQASYSELVKGKMILFVNIVGFKAFNEQRGFKEGNLFLKNVGTLISGIFSDAIICRQSDDHYAIFVNSDNYGVRINKLSDVVGKLDEVIKPQIQIGGYHLSKVEDTRRAVDKARYACILLGGSLNKLYLEYDLQMHNEYHLKQYVIHNVDKAIENGWIVPYYQPVVFSKDSTLCGFEALARWIDPVHGFLSPGTFIPTLEQVKLIHKVDTVLLDSVCKHLRLCLDQNKQILPVSINFSRVDFETMDVISTLNETLAKYDIPKDMVHVEVTESALTQNRNTLLEYGKLLKEAGYAMWLDDFGSGYSSLNSLKDFDFDVMKIDMVFLKNFADNPKAKTIIEAVVLMANQLGMRTLSEGVETKEQFEFLKSIKCERLQGYLFGKPISFEEMAKKIDDGEFVIAKNPF